MSVLSVVLIGLNGKLIIVLESKLKMKLKIILSVAFALLLTACNDKQDNLIVVDGNGNKYMLKHHLGDTYFVREISGVTEVNDYVKQANSKLESK